MQLNLFRYAAEIGPKILDDMAKNYFKISFPLPKMDMAAIPDFAAGSLFGLILYFCVDFILFNNMFGFFSSPIGAMENWGLITYR